MLSALKKIFSAEAEPASQPVLTKEQLKFWRENGYLILPGCLSAAEQAEVLSIVEDQWNNREGNDHEVDCISGPLRGRAYRMHEADPSIKNEIYKLNNLFGRVKAIRKISHTPFLKAAITFAVSPAASFASAGCFCWTVSLLNNSMPRGPRSSQP